MRLRPPKKKGQGQGPRTINGLVLGVREAAAFVGVTEKNIRGKIARRLIPYRRLGGRIIFIRAELEAWLTGLPGCTLAEAEENRNKRYQ